jgi:hypothetical protein
LGSSLHVITSYNSGLVFTYTGLAPLSLIRQHVNRSIKRSSGAEGDSKWIDTPVRFAANTNRWGKIYVGVEDGVAGSGSGDDEDWWEEKWAEQLISRCEDLNEAFMIKAGRKPPRRLA